jgi:integrase
MASMRQRSTGTWELRVEAGYNALGKRITRRKTVRMGKREAEKELAKFQTEVEADEYIAPEKMTFAAFVGEWDAKYAKNELAPLTLKTYHHHLKNHILPAIGHLRLDQIKPIRLVTLLDELGKPGARKDNKGDTLSGGTIQYIYRVMKNVFSRATDWKLIKSNPLNGIKKPRANQGDISFYDEDEVQKAIDALYKEPALWRYFCVGALLGGFRRGELLGLEWSDVDYENNYISVNKSISLTIDGQAVIKGPKNKGSKRSVPMPEWFMLELKDYHHGWKINRIKIGDIWLGGDHQYVFHSGFGKPLYHTQPSKWWRGFCKRHQLKRIRFHDLRHSAATILIQSNESLKVIQERLGHATLQTTADTYTHVTQSMSRAAADKLDKFNPRKKLSSTIRQQQ